MGQTFWHLPQSMHFSLSTFSWYFLPPTALCIVPSRAEITAKPTSPEGGNDHQAGKDQQEEVAKLGVKYAAYGYDQHHDSKIRGNL